MDPTLTNCTPLLGEPRWCSTGPGSSLGRLACFAARKLLYIPPYGRFQFDVQVLGLVGLGEFLVVDGVLCLDDFSLVSEAQELAFIRVEFHHPSSLPVL